MGLFANPALPKGQPPGRGGRARTGDAHVSSGDRRSGQPRSADAVGLASPGRGLNQLDKRRSGTEEGEPGHRLTRSSCHVRRPVRAAVRRFRSWRSQTWRPGRPRWLERAAKATAASPKTSSEGGPGRRRRARTVGQHPRRAAPGGNARRQLRQGLARRRAKEASSGGPAGREEHAGAAQRRPRGHLTRSHLGSSPAWRRPLSY